MQSSDIRLVELAKRLRWFLWLRVGAATLLILLAVVRHYVLGPSELGRTMVMAGLLLYALDILYRCHYEWRRRKNSGDDYIKDVIINLQVQMIFDYLVLGYLVYIFGGLESPMVYLFLIHVILSCLFFGRFVSACYMVGSLLLITFISMGIYHGLLPERHFLKGAFVGEVYNSPVYYHTYFLGIIFIYSVVWYIVSSITEALKKRENLLQETIDEMIRVDREKTRYMLTTTHELKAPFAAIQSYVNMILGGYAGEVSGPIGKIMEKIRDRCEKLMMMITGMLRLSNLKSQRDKAVIMEVVNLSEIVQTVIKRYEDIVKEKGLRFITPPSGQTEMIANKEQLEILMMNLVSNAVNYSYPGGLIEITMEDAGKDIKVKVIDQGMGIKEEQLPKVFLEYYRTEEAVKMNKNSTGLGLATAKEIMDLHHGKIWIDSKEGKGTTVNLLFPK